MESKSHKSIGESESADTSTDQPENSGDLPGPDDRGEGKPRDVDIASEIEAAVGELQQEEDE